MFELIPALCHINILQFLKPHFSINILHPKRHKFHHSLNLTSSLNIEVNSNLARNIRYVKSYVNKEKCK